MHPRNIFKSGVKFSELAEKYDFFKPFVIEVSCCQSSDACLEKEISLTCRLLQEPESTKVTLNFDDRDAVRALSKAILAEYYGLNVDIPPDCLRPRIPLRVNYILWIEDLLDQLTIKNKETETAIGLDIGKLVIVVDIGIILDGLGLMRPCSTTRSIYWLEVKLDVFSLILSFWLL